ncbi:hypothetical protein [Chryseobacterium sp. G0186]|uniref:hypothetical protein n=1 Tax=Chryseobacterium sp. G0186 TaxID=2487064 RepID=UPI0013DE3D67|nr:hypothetical protein [Chryseobacterium sp. G0186]
MAVFLENNILLIIQPPGSLQDDNTGMVEVIPWILMCGGLGWIVLACVVFCIGYMM